ncbi:MAG: hypothetical protein D6692_00840 [Planctomycetota bacterium]|nr:MAG: hypothetical protein D6692_00840 [Planctomycetota bacterium]
MKRIHHMLESVAQSLNCECQHFQHHSRLSVGHGTRHQDIEVRVVDDDYELTSVVLPTSDVTATADGWRGLARLAWQRNADSDIVTFTFDDRDRLVGRVRHPATTMDIEEMSLYVQSLVRECDRFEYLLSGLDRY